MAVPGAIRRGDAVRVLSETEERIRPLAGEMSELVHEVVKQCKQAIWLLPEFVERSEGGVKVFCTCGIYDGPPSVPDKRTAWRHLQHCAHANPWTKGTPTQDNDE